MLVWWLGRDGEASVLACTATFFADMSVEAGCEPVGRALADGGFMLLPFTERLPEGALVLALLVGGLAVVVPAALARLRGSWEPATIVLVTGALRVLAAVWTSAPFGFGSLSCPACEGCERCC